MQPSVGYYLLKRGGSIGAKSIGAANTRDSAPILEIFV